MTRLSGNCETHLKFELTEEEKDRFRWACEHFSRKIGERYSMSKTMRSLVYNFVEDMVKDAAGETSAEDLGDAVAS